MTTVNPLDLAQWEKTLGRLYRAAIERGAMTVMSAHIALVREAGPDARVESRFKLYRKALVPFGNSPRDYRTQFHNDAFNRANLKPQDHHLP